MVQWQDFPFKKVLKKNQIENYLDLFKKKRHLMCGGSFDSRDMILQVMCVACIVLLISFDTHGMQRIKVFSKHVLVTLILTCHKHYHRERERLTVYHKICLILISK